jgi:hypothetical protein
MFQVGGGEACHTLIEQLAWGCLITGGAGGMLNPAVTAEVSSD